jgi:arylsulfatase A-like enzyme
VVEDGHIIPPGADTGVTFDPAPVKIVTEPARNAFRSACELPLEYLRRIRRGYFPGRSPDVLMVPRAPNWFGGWIASSHSGPWDYLQRVPMVFYGPGFISGKGAIQVRREITAADIAPTLAELLGVSMPANIPGRAIHEVLLPEEERNGRPRMILVVVWDGGGWNTLDAWPDQWPVLKRLTEEGSFPADAIVGSSPSVTPAVHTTIGTGTFPKQSGIVTIRQRMDGRFVGAFGNKHPQHLLTPTLADIYDPTTNNEAKIGLLAFKSWHFGMIGHGATYPGGDNDIAVVLNQAERFVTNTSVYSVPDYLDEIPGFGAALRSVDLTDGKVDDTWMGHEILDDPAARRDTPAWVLHQTRVIKTILRHEQYGADDIPDMFFTNYKQIDEAGHDWNFINPEMREVVRYTDAGLGDLVQSLNRRVGRDNYVVVVTADHGQGPDALASGAWPISMGELTKDLAANFDVPADELIVQTSPTGLFVNGPTLEAHDITQKQIAEWLVDYRLEDNVAPGGRWPEQYRPRRREPILSAAFPSEWLGRAWACARSN